MNKEQELQIKEMSNMTKFSKLSGKGAEIDLETLTTDIHEVSNYKSAVASIIVTETFAEVLSDLMVKNAVVGIDASEAITTMMDSIGSINHLVHEAMEDNKLVNMGVCGILEMNEIGIHIPLDKVILEEQMEGEE